MTFLNNYDLFKDNLATDALFGLLCSSTRHSFRAKSGYSEAATNLLKRD